MRSARILILILVFSIVGFSQTAGDSDTGLPVDIPSQAMEQVIRRLLTWSFKPQKVRRTVYLYDERIDPSWLPVIKNVDFELVSFDRLGERPEGIYHLGPICVSRGRFVFEFAFGDPVSGGTTRAEGTSSWAFRVSKQKVRLWQNTRFPYGCGLGIA